MRCRPDRSAVPIEIVQSRDWHADDEAVYRYGKTAVALQTMRKYSDRLTTRRSVRIATYILRHDSGFAPNPFHGWCTLACCKPAIRRTFEAGDWILGITPREQGRGNLLAYAMQIKESLSFDDYWVDPRFRAKRPRWKSERLERCGDNCYEPMGNGEYRQLLSQHWDHDSQGEDPEMKAKDVRRGRRVLVAKRFSYFGINAVPIPDHLSLMLPARYNRVNFTPEQKREILAFVKGLPGGIRGRPRDWPDDDASWKKGRAARCG
jgi:hypothetical protein